MPICDIASNACLSHDKSATQPMQLKFSASENEVVRPAPIERGVALER
jgi:hypothetical protein